MTSPKAQTNKKFIPSEEYKNNFDAIFWKKTPGQEPVRGSPDLIVCSNEFFVPIELVILDKCAGCFTPLLFNNKGGWYCPNCGAMGWGGIDD